MSPQAFANWRPEKRINDPKLWKSDAAMELRELPCACCQLRAGETLHHIVPRSQRGDDVLENLIGIDYTCHDQLHHAPNALELAHAIGRGLTPANIAYVVAKKGAGWLESRYGVIA